MFEIKVMVSLGKDPEHNWDLDHVLNHCCTTKVLVADGSTMGDVITQLKLPALAKGYYCGLTAYEGRRGPKDMGYSRALKAGDRVVLVGGDMWAAPAMPPRVENPAYRARLRKEEEAERVVLSGTWC